MAERIELPMAPAGTEQEQLQQMYSYLYRTAQALNINLERIGEIALTDEEQALFNNFNAALNSPQNGGAGEELYTGYTGYAEAETLKSLIIKTAQFVKTEMDNYRLILFGEESAEGQYGNWIRKKGLRVDVTPDGIKQTYSYAEIVKGLKTYEINTKNYIKTGYLHDDENNMPVYGVAIGKDIVTFSEDGAEQYNDGKKVAELTADELSFWMGEAPNQYKLASFTGTDIIFYQGGSARLKINASGVTILNGSNKLAELLSTALKFYYNNTLRAQMDNDGILFCDGDSTDLASLTASALQFYHNGTLRTKMDGNGVTISNGSTKLAELLDSALTFYHYGTKRAVMDGDGIAFFDGSTDLAKLTASALQFYYNGTLRSQMDSSGIGFYDGSTSLATLTSGALQFYYNGTLQTKMDSDGISFWNGSTKLAEINSSKISFFSGGTEVFYIQSGTIYSATNLNLSSGKDIVLDSWTFNNHGARYANGSKKFEVRQLTDMSNDATGAVIFGSTGRYGRTTDGLSMMAGSSDGSKGFVCTESQPINSGGTPAYKDIDTYVEAKDSAGNTPTVEIHWNVWDIFQAECGTVKYYNLVQRSSREEKENIEPISAEVEAIDRLQPVRFRYKKYPDETHFGLIYEDTVEIMPEICTDNGRSKGIKYTEIIPILLKEIQDLRKRVTALEGGH